MAGPSSILFYKGGTGLGGAINTGALITSGASNNLFGLLTASQIQAGVDQYQCIYLKNVTSEELNDVFFWLSYRDLTGVSVWRFARGSSGRNGTEQTIANINTAPVGVTWRELSEIPFTPMISTFDAGDVYPIWVWRHVPATPYYAEGFSKKDDPCIFNGAFKIGVGGSQSPGEGPGGGGGGSGGGGGGSPPPTTADYRMIFVGDEGCENKTDDVINLIEGLITAAPAGTPVLLVSVGDHAYESASCWTTRFQPLKTSLGDNFQGAYGNHEYEESGGIAPYNTFFGRTKTYFTKKFQNVELFFWDTNIDLDDGSTQNDSMVDEMDRVLGDSSIKWRIAVMHHPWFIDGSRNEANEFNQIQELHQLFIDKKISMVITGHNHNWQRTHQVSYNSGDPLHSPNIVDSTSPYVSSAAGLIHVVTGAGGHDSGTGLYQLPSQPSFQAYQSRLYNGVWVIDASNTGTTWSGYFVNVDNVSFDNFVINL